MEVGGRGQGTGAGGAWSFFYGRSEKSQHL